MGPDEATATPSLNRRSFLASSGLAVLAAQGRPSLASASSPSLPLRRAMWSDHAVNSFGINIQPWNNNNYANFGALEKWLTGSGVRHFRSRTSIPVKDPANVFMARMCRQHGMRWHATAGGYDPHDRHAERAAARRATEPVLLEYADCFDSLAGYNEPNGTRMGPLNPHWASITLAHQEWLWDFHARHASLRHLKICGPSLLDHPPRHRHRSSDQVLKRDYLHIAACAPFMDKIEMHRYPSGGLPSSGIDQRVAWARAGVGHKRVVASETGYNVMPGRLQSVPEVVQGIYVQRLLAEYMSRGFSCFAFDLLCQYDRRRRNSEDWYGMVAAPSAADSRLISMLAYRTMRRFLAKFRDGHAPYTPRPLRMKVTGDNAVKTLLFGKRDGSYLLMMWNDVKAYDVQTRTRLAPRSAHVFVETEQARPCIHHKFSMEGVNPRGGTNGTLVPAHTSHGWGHNVAVDEHLVVLEIAA